MEQSEEQPLVTLIIALLNTHARLLLVIAAGFPTVALDRGASSFATALHIRERYGRYPNPFGLCSWFSITIEVRDICEKPRHVDEP